MEGQFRDVSKPVVVQEQLLQLPQVGESVLLYHCQLVPAEVQHLQRRQALKGSAGQPAQLVVAQVQFLQLEEVVDGNFPDPFQLTGGQVQSLQLTEVSGDEHAVRKVVERVAMEIEMQEMVKPEEMIPFEGPVGDAVVGEVEVSQARQVEEDVVVEEVDLVVRKSEVHETPSAAVHHAAGRPRVVDLKHRVHYNI